MITLIHGPAELLRAEALADIRARIAQDPAMVDLNTTRLEGPEATLSALQNACDTLPFLTTRRFIVADGMLSRLSDASKHRKSRPAGEDDDASSYDASEEAQPGEAKSATKALLAYLDRVPDTAELVFLEPGVIKGGPVMRRLLALQRDQQAVIITCQNPRKYDLTSWIKNRAKRRRVKLDAGAVADLADSIGDDLRQLDQELIKLADYAGGSRTITRADVRRLVAATRAANVFEMVEAIGMGDAKTAGRLMRHALDVDGEQPLRLMGMISRQYRLLIQTKALQAQGVKGREMAKRLNVPDWTVGKLQRQAGRHSFARLEAALEQLVAADEAIKTGKMGDREAMDVLFAELMREHVQH